jgi:high-affinity Fe2+/Pb2+ permease
VLSAPMAVLANLWILFIIILFILPPNEQAGYVMAGILAILVGLWFGIERRRFKGPPEYN